MVDVEQETNGDIGVIWMLQYGAPDMGTHDALAKARSNSLPRSLIGSRAQAA